MNIRHLNFKYISNLRDIGGYVTKDNRVTKFNRIMRSSLIKNLEPEEFEYLKRNNLCLNIDIRNKNDLNVRVNYLQDKVKFINIPFNDEIPALEKDIPAGYMALVEDRNIKLIFDAIRENKGLIIINCSMGKDRTGVIMMLIELLCGVTNKDIISDYMLSYNYVKDDVNLFHLNHPEYPAWVGASKSWYMEETIKLFFDKYHDVNSYFIDYLGLKEEELNEIRESLLDNE
jgi:protein-tyrosine phosphatase